LKIGQYLVKVWARVRCLVFLTHGVYSKLHHDWFGRFSMARGCDRETHTYRQTDRQTHRPRYICNNRPHTYEFLSKRSFVVLREVFFERQNDAVSDDREQHHVLERRSHQQALLRIVYTVRFIRYETPFNVLSKADILVKQLNLLHELKNGRICGKF